MHCVPSEALPVTRTTTTGGLWSVVAKTNSLGQVIYQEAYVTSTARPGVLDFNALVTFIEQKEHNEKS